MPDKDRKIERLRAELESAFRNRGDLYRLIYNELAASIGDEKAEAVLAAAIEKRGKEVAHAAFSRFDGTDARAVGEAFLAVSPDDGCMYPADVQRFDGGIEFHVNRCPLKDSWVESGLSEPEIARLCRIAGAFDRGLFEEIGVRFQNWTWHEGDGPGCCRIRLTNRLSASAA